MLLDIDFRSEACVPVKPPEKLLNLSRKRKKGMNVRSESKGRGTRDMMFIFYRKLRAGVGCFDTAVRVR